MQLSRGEFQDRYGEGKLRLALIGMSNIGKSYTGMRLANDYDFSLIEVDRLIWESLGHSSMEDFASWQGHPYSEGYQAREEQSIALEDKATAKALRTRAHNPLIDTTGSVIYTSDKTRMHLKDKYYVVYIEATKDALARLKTTYFVQPKPLIWAGHYQQFAGLSPEESILECYPKLLTARANSYDALADTRLTSDFILNPKTTSDEIFDAICPAS